MITRLETEILRTQSHLHCRVEESEHEYSIWHRMEAQREFVFLKCPNTILLTAYTQYDDSACVLGLRRSRGIVVCTGTMPFEEPSGSNIPPENPGVV